MASIGETITQVTGGSKDTLMTMVWILVIIFVVVMVLVAIFIWWYFKKRYNLKVEIKLTREDGQMTHGEWGKGNYDTKKGVVFIKRPGVRGRPIPMPIFDVRRYLQGKDLLTVIQVGPEDFRPVLNKSWSEHEVEYEDQTDPVKDENGNFIFDEKGKQMFNKKIIKEAILTIKTEPGLNKAWKTAWDAAAKKAFSLQTFFQQFQTPIAIGIVLISCFVGFAILWSKI